MWVATALAVEWTLVYLALSKSTVFLVLDRPMVVYHQREAWDHHLLRMLAVETRVAHQCEE